MSKIMKSLIGLIVVGIIVGVFALTIFMLNDLFESTAQIQRCQRLTGYGFFECGQFNDETLQLELEKLGIEESKAPKELTNEQKL